MYWFASWLVEAIANNFYVTQIGHVIWTPTFWSAISPLAAVGITFWTIRHEQRVREESSRPWISVGVRVTDGTESRRMSLQIQNIGYSVAVNTVVSFDPPMVNNQRQRVRYDRAPIPTLAPTEYQEWDIGSLDDLGTIDWMLAQRPASHLVTIKFEDALGKRFAPSPTTIDLRVFTSIPYGLYADAEVVDERATFEGVEFIRHTPGWRKQLWQPFLLEAGIDPDIEIPDSLIGQFLGYCTFESHDETQYLYVKKRAEYPGPEALVVIVDRFVSLDDLNTLMQLIIRGARVVPLEDR